MLKAEHLMHLQTRLGPGVEVGVTAGGSDNVARVEICGPDVTVHLYPMYKEWGADPFFWIDHAARVYLSEERAARPGRNEEESE